MSCPLSAIKASAMGPHMQASESEHSLLFSGLLQKLAQVTQGLELSLTKAYSARLRLP